MSKGTEKRLFSAELQQLKAKGLPLPGKTGSAVSVDNSEVLAAINALREDVRTLERQMRGDEHTSVLQSNDPYVQEAEKKKAEVNMLKTEVRALSVCIQQTKAEIAALRPTASADDRLMAVTNELDAIVTATERATDGILAAAEKIDALAHQLQSHAGDAFVGQIAEDIRDSVVGIFEDCNFQDITGQRITKAVKTLQYIEERVNKMIEIWGADTFEDLPSPPEVHEDEEKKLLNGPALENQGISQADIDKLFG